MLKIQWPCFQWNDIESQGAELARNTASALEFISDTLHAESRYFGKKAYEFLTAKLTGHKYQRPRDGSLDPLAGVGTASVNE